MNIAALNRLPIFRSPEQTRILSEVFVYADQPLSLTELAARAGTSSGGAHKEISRLEAAGLVTSRRVGRTRLVSANSDSPFFEDLRRLLLKAFGPASLLKQSLANLPGIKRAFIYGSWAESESLPLGRPPRDIDVMILGEPDLDQVYEVVADVEAEIGRPVNVNVFTEAEWTDHDSGFAKSVKAAPQIELIP